jgi:uncharacterized protein (TIGR02246 family)
MKPIGLLLCLWILSVGPAEAQTEQDKATVGRLPQAFSDAFNKHDGHALATIMAEDVDFVTVGLTWLHGRADFEKFHTRLLTGRFKEITFAVLETHVRFIRPDLALVRYSWTGQGDKNADGSARPQRYGLMTMLAEKQNGSWLVVAVQNTNGPVGPNNSQAELEGIKSPLVVPRAKE